MWAYFWFSKVLSNFSPFLKAQNQIHLWALISFVFFFSVFTPIGTSPSFGQWSGFHPRLFCYGTVMYFSQIAGFLFYFLSPSFSDKNTFQSHHVVLQFWFCVLLLLSFQFLLIIPLCFIPKWDHFVFFILAIFLSSVSLYLRFFPSFFFYTL